jgi:hypothetical protein
MLLVLNDFTLLIRLFFCLFFLLIFHLMPFFVLLLLQISFVPLMFLHILLIAVPSHVALLSFITEDGLKLLEELPHYYHYLLGVY